MNVSSSGRLAGTVATVSSIRWTTITSRRYTVGGINNVSKSIHDFVGIVKTIDRMRKDRGQLLLLLYVFWRQLTASWVRDWYSLTTALSRPNTCWHTANLLY